MGIVDDARDREVIGALRRPADAPPGMTARLEASVRRRSRVPTGFTAGEKWSLAMAGIFPFLAGGAGGGIVLLLVAVAGVAGYLQWTVLVEDEAST